MTFSSIERNAKRLRIYIGDSDLWRGKPLYSVLLEQLKHEGLAGATVIRGIASYGAHSRIHTTAILALSTDLPLIIEVIDSPDKIQHALEIISPMVREGLVTLEDVEVITYTHRFLRPLPADRHVREIMTRNPVTLLPDQPLIDAWQTMLARNLKALPVVASNGRVVGILTHEDLLDRVGLSARLAVAQKLDEVSLQAEMDILRNSGKTVSDVMSQPAITLEQDDPLGLAAERLVRYGITRLPVIAEDGRLVGMVSRLDVLRQVMDIPEREPQRPSTRPEGRLAGEVALKAIPLVRENTDLAGIIASFLSSGEHRVIVLDDADQPVGLISDSDVVGRIQPAQRRGVLGALRGLIAAPVVSVTAREIMSPGAETIPADTSVVEAIRRMVASQRKWLVVIGETGKPIGLIDREVALESLI